MRLLLLLAIVTLNTSCGLILDGDVKEGKTRQFSSTDEVLLPYVASFEEKARVTYGKESFKVGDIPVNFGDTTDDKYDGVCIKYPDGTKEIILKKSWFDRTSETQREILIYHELGHCRLNRKHNSSVGMAYDNNISVKMSIMNPVVPSSYYYEVYQDAYLRELFHQDNNLMVAALDETNTEDDEAGGSVQGGSSPHIECDHKH